MIDPNRIFGKKFFFFLSRKIAPKNIAATEPLLSRVTRNHGTILESQSSTISIILVRNNRKGPSGLKHGKGVRRSHGTKLKTVIVGSLAQDVETHGRHPRTPLGVTAPRYRV